MIEQIQYVDVNKSYLYSTVTTFTALSLRRLEQAKQLVEEKNWVSADGMFIVPSLHLVDGEPRLFIIDIDLFLFS